MTSLPGAPTALQKGDLVLITGGTGWVGSHVVDQALQHGLNVRLAYRSKAKVDELKSALERRYPDMTIETAHVPSFDKTDAYDEALNDGKVKGIVHVASVLDGYSWETMVLPPLKNYEVLLQAAARQPSVKRVVLTSSSVAAALSNIDKDEPVQNITSASWNELSLRCGQEPDAAWIDIYAASKVASEQLAWRFVRENKPGFVLNSVLPSFSVGRLVEGTQYSSTAQWLRSTVIDANESSIVAIGAQYFIDVDDVAILHILGLIDESVKNERLLGYNESVSWNQWIDLAHKFVPNVNTPSKSELSAHVDRNTVDRARTIDLLKPYGGLKGQEETFKRAMAV